MIMKISYWRTVTDILSKKAGSVSSETGKMKRAWQINIVSGRISGKSLMEQIMQYAVVF